MGRLIAPDAGLRVSFLAAMDEFAAEGRAGGRTMVEADLAEYGERWRTEAGFVAYLEAVRAEEHTPRWADFVTQTTRWWVEDGEYIGRVSVRHRLTEELRRLGGHVGYDVRRSRRREGHATAMLGSALPLVASLGIDPALITCDTTNVASRRVIERNGGVLEDECDGTLRFWVSTHR
jgi:predicted acetyltransferase